MGSVPQCSLSREYPVALRVDAGLLKKLDEHLRAFGNDVHYSVDVTDGSSIAFDELDQLLAFDNGKSRAIREIRASASGVGRATISITEKTELRKPVGLTVHGPDEAVAPFVARIEKWIKDSSQTWTYTVFARQSFLSLSMFVGVLEYGTLYIGGAIARAAEGDLSLAAASQASGKDLTALGYLVLAFFFSLPFTLGFALNKMRSAWWPSAVFLIGQGERRHQDLTSLRNLWLLGLLIPIAALVIGLAAA